VCSFFFPVVFVDFFNSPGSEQTKIYRAEIPFCCGAIRVDTKSEVRMSTVFLGGAVLVRLSLRTGQLDVISGWLKSNRCTIAGIAVCVDKAVPLA
jgi:hypothetical protein